MKVKADLFDEVVGIWGNVLVLFGSIESESEPALVPRSTA
jgi:hypothetical protein